MNVTFPDNANIQIFVVPHGSSPPIAPVIGAAPALLAAPVHGSSRRRTVVFLGVGVAACAIVLAVARSQSPPTGMGIDPLRVPRPLEKVELAPRLVPPVRPIPERTDSTASAPSSDLTETVKRLLDQRPTVTPPPGTPVPSTSAPTAGGGSRNAFGMSD